MTTLLVVVLSHLRFAFKIFPPEFGMLLQNQKICEASFSKYCEDYRETWHLCLLTDHTFAPFHLYCKPRSDQSSYKLYQDEQFYVSDKISDQACHLPINPRRAMYTSGQVGLGKFVVDISSRYIYRSAQFLADGDKYSYYLHNGPRHWYHNTRHIPIVRINRGDLF